MTVLQDWENFYVIVGSSAGALIGLQFVVITLLADLPIERTDPKAGQAFGTPNVVHFGVALLLSAIVSVPWDGIEVVAIIWGLLGISGMVYAAVVCGRMRAQTAYETVLEDWVFHALLPLTAYAMMALAAGVAYWHVRLALFAVGAAALLLLYIGIHNAWDTVTYHVFVSRREARENEKRERP